MMNLDLNMGRLEAASATEAVRIGEAVITEFGLQLGDTALAKAFDRLQCIQAASHACG